MGSEKKYVYCYTISLRLVSILQIILITKKNKIRKMKNQLSFLLAVGLHVLVACNNNGKPIGYESDTHGRGKATIFIEESFKPLFDTSIYTFESQFPRASITPVYKSEGQIIADFFDKKVKTICITREFTSNEIKRLKQQQVELRTDKVAQDGVALIVHPENLDTTITVDELKRILKGEKSTWTNSKSPINVVFDQENSANFNFLMNLVKQKQLPVNVFAVKSNAEVINYVKKHKNALGVIGLNWISDQDDFNTLDFVNGIKVMSVSNGGGYFKPYAGFIYTKEYPLARPIYMINKAKRSGLHTGFVLFMIGEKGQLIVQKSALVPANAPIRLIQMTTE
jgi:phosphate transport system substrate-binding protein